MPVTRDWAASGVAVSDGSTQDPGPDTSSGRRTLLGFDFGLRRIGVAIGQELTRTATALITLKAQDGSPDWEQVAGLVRTWRPDALVVGIPHNMDGTEHELTHAALRFVRRLEGRFHLPVYRVDERLTSVEAQNIIATYGRPPGRRKKGKKTELDSVAAQVILQNWLDQDEKTHGANG